MRGSQQIKKIICFLLIAYMAGSTAYAQESSDRYVLRVDGGALGPVMEALHDLTGTQFLFSSDLANLKGVQPLNGQYTIQEALDVMLKGTGLSGGLTKSGMVVITREKGAVAPSQREEIIVKKQVKKSLLAGVSAFVLGALQAPAFAQTAEGENAPQYVRDEIIVTATKRATNLQDTAMSISAISSETIKRKNLIGMEDYLRSVPSANFIDGGPGFHELVLRGLSTSAEGSGGTNGPLVGVYFGETPISGMGINGGSSDIKLIDMERIEVLKGPQGTLYGASSMGGVVRNIPAAPDLGEYSANLKVGYSNTARYGSDNSNVEAMVNIPLVEDKLAVRAVVYHFDNSGHYRNVSANDPTAIALAQSIGGNTTFQDDIGATTYTGGRVSLLWTPTDEFSANLAYLHQEVRTNGWGQASADVGGTYDQARLLLRYGTSIADAGLPIHNESFDDTISILQGTLSYDFGWGTLTSTTSQVKQNPDWNRDLTGIFIGSQLQEYDGKNLIEELRLSSQFDGPLQFVAGYYFEDQKLDTANNIFWNGDDALIPVGALELFRYRENRRLKQHAVFGEVSYDVTDKLTVTGGARAFDQNRVSNTSSATNTDPLIVNPVETSVSDVTFKAGVDYKPNDDMLLYANWSQGFRLGAVQNEILDPSCDVDGDGFYDMAPDIKTGVRAVDSDNVDNFEVGSKTTLLDGRLQLNASAYQINWNDMPVVVSVCGGNFGTSVNAGTARVRGLEVEASYHVGNGLMLDFSGAYTKGELTTTSSLGNDGDQLPSSPEWSFNLGAEYNFDLGGNDAYARASYAYISGFSGFLGGGDPELGNFGKVDASVGVNLGDFDVSLFARNLTNAEAITNIAFSFANRRSYLRPRTVGVQLGYSF